MLSPPMLPSSALLIPSFVCSTAARLSTGNGGDSNGVQASQAPHSSHVKPGFLAWTSNFDNSF